MVNTSSYKIHEVCPKAKFVPVTPTKRGEPLLHFGSVSILYQEPAFEFWLSIFILHELGIRALNDCLKFIATNITFAVSKFFQKVFNSNQYAIYGSYGCFIGNFIQLLLPIQFLNEEMSNTNNKIYIDFNVLNQKTIENLGDQKKIVRLQCHFCFHLIKHDYLNKVSSIIFVNNSFSKIQIHIFNPFQKCLVRQQF